MLGINEITALAEQNGVTFGTVERDYAMSHIVASIAAQTVSERLEFKGGTALRLCHFVDYRYSADIDLNLFGGLTRTEALAGIRRALDDTKERLAIPQLELSDEDGHIQFVGPRGQQRPEKIKLDLSEDELVSGIAMRMPVLQRYDDQIPNEGLPTYSLVEVTSEKLRCVIQRLQCRDAYDLYRLLCEADGDVEIAWPRFEEKAIHKGLDPKQFWDRFDTRMTQYAQRWTGEMSGYIGEYPDFAHLERSLRRALRVVRN